MRKKILFIVSVYRVGERVYPIIPKLHEFADLDLLQVNEMSEWMNSYGNVNVQQLFHQEYDSFFDNIYDGTITSIESMGARNDIPSQAILDMDVSKYDMVIYDDDRNRHGLHSIYKRIKCPMIGNVHGNFWYPDSGKSNIKNCYKKVFSHAFVFGEKERQSHEPNDYVLVGGIPSNDNLKYYDRTDNFILVIVNFLGNMKGSIPDFYRVLFDETFMENSGLVELQKKYNKKVVFKLKSRAAGPQLQRDIDYLHGIVSKELDYDIVVDFEDNNQLICGSFLVIAAPSVLTLKPIQKGIPTVVIKGAGLTGNFYDYRGFVNLNKTEILKEVENQISTGRDIDFIENTIGGGVDFNSTKKYVDSIRGLLNG